jgi:hypothetical protein
MTIAPHGPLSRTARTIVAAGAALDGFDEERLEDVRLLVDTAFHALTNVGDGPVDISMASSADAIELALAARRRPTARWDDPELQALRTVIGVVAADAAFEDADEVMAVQVVIGAEPTRSGRAPRCSGATRGVPVTVSSLPHHERVDWDVSMRIPCEARFARVARTAAATCGVIEGFSIDELADLRLLVDEVYVALLELGAGHVDVRLALDGGTLVLRMDGTHLSADDGEVPDLAFLRMLTGVVATDVRFDLERPDPSFQATLVTR